jgi:prephenate dehydrogenase
METLVEIITELRAEIAELKTMLEKEKETSDTFYKAYKRENDLRTELILGKDE